jgi:hypothetical protein
MRTHARTHAGLRVTDLDVGGEDVEAARQDHVLFAVADEQKPVAVLMVRLRLPLLMIGIIILTLLIVLIVIIIGIVVAVIVILIILIHNHDNNHDHKNRHNNHMQTAPLTHIAPTTHPW